MCDGFLAKPLTLETVTLELMNFIPYSRAAKTDEHSQDLSPGISKEEICSLILNLKENPGGVDIMIKLSHKLVGNNEYKDLKEACDSFDTQRLLYLLESLK